MSITSLERAFNQIIGDISASLSSISFKKSDGIFDFIGKTATHETQKAIRSYNFKAAIYNCLTIGCLATAIFRSPTALIGFGACLIGRMFVDSAMDKTFWGAQGNHYQKTQDSVAAFLFKPFIK